MSIILNMEDILSQRPCQAWTISTVSGMRGMHSCKMEKLVVLNQFGGKQNNSPLSDTYHLCLPSLDVLDLIEHRCYWKNELNVDCNFTWFVVTVPNITVLPPLSSHHWGHGFQPYIEHLIARAKNPSTLCQKLWVFSEY